MNNKHLEKRLEGIFTLLKGVYEASSATPNETKGTEREAFVDGFLNAVLPSTTRIGKGAVTDKFNNISGQLDVVIEYPLLPSVTLLSDLKSRLYLAEGVAIVIEIKSDLAHQWDQVVATSDKLAIIRRYFGNTISPRNRHPAERIPFIAVGYKGWKDPETIKKKVKNTPNIDAILDIDLGYFYAEIPFITIDKSEEKQNAVLNYYTYGADALWGFICVLNEQINDLSGMEALASNYTFQNLEEHK